MIRSLPPSISYPHPSTSLRIERGVYCGCYMLCSARLVSLNIDSPEYLLSSPTSFSNDIVANSILLTAATSSGLEMVLKEIDAFM